MSEAAAALLAARAVYDAAAAPVMQSLLPQASYQSARSAAEAARQNVEDLRTAQDATAADRVAAAQLALAARAVVTSLQNQAIASDPTAAAARSGLASAAAASAKLRQEFEAGLKQNSDLQSAKDALAAARVKASAADQSLAAAQKELAAQQVARAAALSNLQKLNRQVAAGGR